MYSAEQLENVRLEMAFFDALPPVIRAAANEFHLSNVIGEAKRLGFNPEEPLSWDGDLIYESLKNLQARFQERKLERSSLEYEARTRPMPPARPMPDSLASRFGATRLRPTR